jgi:hypothetical protein
MRTIWVSGWSGRTTPRSAPDLGESRTLRTVIGPHRRPFVLGLGLAVVLGAAACSPAPSAVPSASPGQAASPSSGAASPSGTGASPSASPSGAGASGGSPSGDPASPCPIEEASGNLGSDALVEVRVDTGDTADQVIFRFGPPIFPQGQHHGILEEIQRPVIQGGSGEELDVDGERIVRVAFDGQSLTEAPPSEQPTYQGPRRFDGPGPGVRTVAIQEAFEGVFAWAIGFDGPGCVGLTSDSSGTTIVVEIEHPS